MYEYPQNFEVDNNSNATWVTNTREPGGVNPVHDEMELELVTSDKGDDNLPK
jgi:hypothetical protein